MPNRWGRLTGQDFMQWAGGIESMKNSYRDYQKWNDYQEDRQKQQQLEEDINYNASLYEPGAVQYGEGTPYADQESAIQGAMRGSPLAKVKGKRLYFAGLQADTEIHEKQKQAKIKARADNILKYLSDNPGTDPDLIPRHFLAGEYGLQGYGLAMRIFGETQENSFQASENFQKKEAQVFEKFSALRSDAQSFYDSGNIEQAAKMLQKASKYAGKVQTLGEFDPKTQTFNIQYLDPKTTEQEPTGKKMSFQEAMAFANNLSQDRFMTLRALQAKAIREGNHKKFENPEIWKNKKGERYQVLALENPHEPSQVDIHIFDKVMNKKLVHSRKELFRMGLSPENLKQENQRLKNQREYAALQGQYLTNEGRRLDNQAARIRLDQVNNPRSKPLSMEQQVKDYDRRAQAFAIQARKLGVEVDQATGEVTGNVPTRALPELEKLARYYGVQLAASQGQMVDTNGWKWGGKEEFTPIQVLPFGTKPFEDMSAILQKGDKYNKKPAQALGNPQNGFYPLFQNIPDWLVNPFQRVP